MRFFNSYYQKFHVFDIFMPLVQICDIDEHLKVFGPDLRYQQHVCKRSLSQSLIIESLQLKHIKKEFTTLQLYMAITGTFLESLNSILPELYSETVVKAPNRCFLGTGFFFTLDRVKSCLPLGIYVCLLSCGLFSQFCK